LIGKKKEAWEGAGAGCDRGGKKGKNPAGALKRERGGKRSKKKPWSFWKKKNVLLSRRGKKKKEKTPLEKKENRNPHFIHLRRPEGGGKKNSRTQSWRGWFQ